MSEISILLQFSSSNVQFYPQPMVKQACDSMLLLYLVTLGIGSNVQQLFCDEFCKVSQDR